MRLLKLVVICVVGLLISARGTQARRIGRHRRGPQKFVPVYRAMDEQLTPTTTEEESERQLEPVQPKPISSTKFLLLKSAATAPSATASAENSNAGRTFKHLLLYKNLLSPQKETYYGGGHGGGYTLPYIIINTPTNLTNINNNTLSNVPPTVPPVTTTTGTGTVTTGTGTGTGTGAGAGTRIGGIGGGAAGFAYLNRPQQALPMAIPMPTQVYQQRETNTAQQLPYNLVNLLGMNGLSGLIPVTLPAQPNMNQRRRGQPQRRRGQPQRRRAPPAAPQQNSFNPFAAFANSFRGIQFL